MRKKENKNKMKSFQKNKKPRALAEKCQGPESTQKLEDSSVLFEAKFTLRVLFALQMATDDELHANDLGTTKGCHFIEIPAPPTPGPIVMVMTMAMDI